MKREAQIEWLLFAVIVSFGVLGRWFQVQWNVTPTASPLTIAG